MNGRPTEKQGVREGAESAVVSVSFVCGAPYCFSRCRFRLLLQDRESSFDQAPRQPTEGGLRRLGSSSKGISLTFTLMQVSQVSLILAAPPEVREAKSPSSFEWLPVSCSHFWLISPHVCLCPFVRHCTAIIRVSALKTIVQGRVALMTRNGICRRRRSH